MWDTQEGKLCDAISKIVDVVQHIKQMKRPFYLTRRKWSTKKLYKAIELINDAIDEKG